jgi:hypothetical protein
MKKMTLAIRMVQQGDDEEEWLEKLRWLFFWL